MVMGVSGAGKSTLAKPLAARLGASFIEADELHPAANVAKMRAGQPLTDADREPWLRALEQRVQALSLDGHDVVLACSALKRAYRRELMRAGGRWLLVYLKADPAALRQRLQARQGHFMPATLLDSQLATLEEPSPDEQALLLDADGALESNLDQSLRAVAACRDAPRSPEA